MLCRIIVLTGTLAVVGVRAAAQSGEVPPVRHGVVPVRPSL